MFAKDHVHPLTVPTHKKRPLWLPGVTTANPQDLLEMKGGLQGLVKMFIQTSIHVKFHRFSITWILNSINVKTNLPALDDI